MSQNILMNPPRVPFGQLDPSTGAVMVTPEWYRWLSDVYARVGGVEGFSNQELYGDAAIQQSHDEMLQRVGGLEAMNRGQQSEALLEDIMNRVAALEATSRALTQGVQMVAMMQMTDPGGTPFDTAEVLEQLTVKGNTRLATERGNVLVGMTSSGTAEQFQVAQNARIQGSARLAGNAGRVVIGSAADDGANLLQVGGTAWVRGGVRLTAVSGRVVIGSAPDDNSNRLQVDGDTKSASYRVGNNQVVGARETGIGSYSQYGGQTVSATYEQTEAQQTDNAVRDASAKLAQIVTALRSHGLIGD